MALDAARLALAADPTKLLAQAMGLRERETPFPWQVELVGNTRVKVQLFQHLTCLESQRVKRVVVYELTEAFSGLYTRLRRACSTTQILRALYLNHTLLNLVHCITYEGASNGRSVA